MIGISFELARHFEGDARALVTVASKAQAAVDYLNVLAGYSPDPMAEVADAA